MKVLSLLLLFFYAVAAQSVWPHPTSLQSGNGQIAIDPATFKFQTTSSSDILREGFERFMEIAFPYCKGYEPSRATDLQVLNVKVDSSSEDLQLEVLENYTLTVGSSNDLLHASTVFGALHGLETFSQLIECKDGHYVIPKTPISIVDAPRFPHRGLLIDTARHYLPVEAILRTIDALSYNKMNVLHWHVSDAESFPLEIPSFPNLTKGAWDPEAIYTAEDVQEIVKHALYRGVRVIPEFDTPGHVHSWGIGYPNIVATCPDWSKNINNIPLTPADPMTLEVVKGVFDHSAKLFPDRFVHIGGDEVVYGCWRQDAKLAQWMKDRNIPSLNHLMQYFEDFLWNHLNKVNKQYIAWEEIFNGYDLQLPKGIVIEVWKGENTLLEVAKANVRGLLAYGWYLDHLKVTWQDFYNHEPFVSSQWTPALEKNVLGGEACAWGEQIDHWNLDQRVWPRASATAERLWSPRTVKDVNAAKPRLMTHICRMNARGIGSAPIAPNHCPF